MARHNGNTVRTNRRPQSSKVVYSTDTVYATRRRTGRTGINRVAAAPGPWMDLA